MQCLSAVAGSRLRAAMRCASRSEVTGLTVKQLNQSLWPGECRALIGHAWEDQPRKLVGLRVEKWWGDGIFGVSACVLVLALACPHPLPEVSV